MNKRKGIIKISDEAYQTLWKEISIIFEDFRPNHIEMRHWENDTWYFYGTSKFFDELKEGEAIPEYQVILKRHGDNIMTYHFEK